GPATLRGRGAGRPAGAGGRATAPPPPGGVGDAAPALPPPLLGGQPLRELLGLGAASTRGGRYPCARRRARRCDSAVGRDGEDPALGAPRRAGALDRRRLRRAARAAPRCAGVPAA